jgi:hypothetical protein
MPNMPAHGFDLARRLSERNPLLALAPIAAAMMFVQIPQTRADDLAVGDQPISCRDWAGAAPRQQHYARAGHFRR